MSVEVSFTSMSQHSRNTSHGLPHPEDSKTILLWSMDLPTFDDLPDGSAWGLWDKDGKRDQLGTLNLLTCDVTVKAAKEVREGVSVSLKYCAWIIEPGTLS